MKITEVEAIILRQPGEIDVTIADGSQDALLIRVHTDEGITGYGEADSLPTVVKAIIDAPRSHKYASGLGALLIGQDPLQPGPLQRRLYDGSIYYGRRGAVIHAISGLEIALWDIAGKAAGQADPRASRRGPPRPRQGVCEHADARHASRGAGGRERPARGGVHRGQARLGSARPGRRARRGAGRRRAGGGRRGRRPDDRHRHGLAQRAGRDRPRAPDGGDRPYWIEEPFMPDEYGKYAALADCGRTPIAAGEEETTVSDFEPPRRQRRRGAAARRHARRRHARMRAHRRARARQRAAVRPARLEHGHHQGGVASTSWRRWRRPSCSSTACRRPSSTSGSSPSSSQSATAGEVPRVPDSASRLTRTSSRRAGSGRPVQSRPGPDGPPAVSSPAPAVVGLGEVMLRLSPADGRRIENAEA